MTAGLASSIASATEHTVRYEELRRHAMDPFRPPMAREGLAVLLRQGVSAWIGEWSRLPATAGRAAQEDRASMPVPDGVNAEVVRVLAGMAMGHILEMQT